MADAKRLDRKEVQEFAVQKDLIPFRAELLTSTAMSGAWFRTHQSRGRKITIATGNGAAVSAPAKVTRPLGKRISVALAA